MNHLLKNFSFFFALLSVVATAQPAFEVVSLVGTAKVQHSEKKSWDKLTPGTKLFDNDLIETYFQTKLILKFGENNITILGSNSKALLNISPNSTDQSKLKVNLTLFGGGLFTKAISGCHVSIYTANAVGELDSGSISTVADGKTGETGFQSMGGSIFTRNIAQQKGIALRSGLTTMILPNKEPTAPLYITHRHVAVLKQFFGDDYIETEMGLSGIEPTEERGTKSRLALSQNLSDKSAKNADQGMYKKQFSMNKIYETILEDRKKEHSFYIPLPDPFNRNSQKVSMGFLANFGITPDGTHNAYLIKPSLNFPLFTAALRLSFVQNMSSEMNAGFNSKEGILDKFENVTIGTDSLFLHAGTLENYTLGYGLIVNRFNNYHPNQIFHPMGLNLQFSLFDIKLKAFLADATSPDIGGIYLDLEPSVYNVGLGYYYDKDHYKFSSDSASSRFIIISKPENTVPDPQRNSSNAQIFEFNFASDLISSHDFRMKLAFEFAQKFFGGKDGLVSRMPKFIFDMNKTRFGLSFVTESGRLLSNHFGSSYILNRYRIKGDLDTLNPLDTIITPHTYLSKERRTLGLNLFYSVNPLKGVDIDIDYKQDFYGANSIKIIQTDSTGDSAIDVKADFSYYVACKLDDRFVPFIKYAEIHLQQYHGALLPYKGSFFSSWLLQAGFHILTKPLFMNTSFEAGGKLWYIDTGMNNVVEPSDVIFEIYTGLKWGI